MLLHDSQSNYYPYLKEFCNAKWGNSKQLQKPLLENNEASHISYAFVQLNLYVSTGTAVYCIDTQAVDQYGSVVTVTTLCSPSLRMSMICAVNNTVFSFGGKDEDNQPNSDVYRHNSAADEWEPAGYMRSSRYSVTVSTFPKDKDNTDIIIIGGILGESEDPKVRVISRMAEICEVGVTFN